MLVNLDFNYTYPHIMCSSIHRSGKDKNWKIIVISLIKQIYKIHYEIHKGGGEHNMDRQYVVFTSAQLGEM